MMNRNDFYINLELSKKNDTLEHHGILGQRWGKRNGPPYPLDEADRSVLERKQQRLEKQVDKIDKKKDNASAVAKAGLAGSLATLGALGGSSIAIEASGAFMTEAALGMYSSIGLGLLASTGAVAVGGVAAAAALSVIGAAKLIELNAVDRKLNSK